jgi:hypothetical protein
MGPVVCGPGDGGQRQIEGRAMMARWWRSTMAGHKTRVAAAAPSCGGLRPAACSLVWQVWWHGVARAVGARAVE